MKRIHLTALAVIFGHLFVSQAIIIKSATLDNLLLSFGYPMAYGAITSVIFLYLFSHEDIFKFAKEIEKKEAKREKKLLHMFGHSGKILAVYLIGTIGGPVFAGLTTRFLLPKLSWRYLLVASTAVPSTLLTMSLAKGVVSFIS